MSEHDPVTRIPLAIVGMACRLPGAGNLDEYWQLLIEGRSSVSEIPADRLDQQLYYDPEVGVRGKSYCKLAATLASRTFNHQACPIPQELVDSADITHLLLCETAAAALRHAGMDPFNLPIRNTGVFIGHVHGSSVGGDYTYATFVEEAAQFLREGEDFRGLPPQEQQLLIDGLIDRVRQKQPLPDANAPDVGSCMAAGTVAKAFGFSGPFISLDSACASSLQAMLFGVRALQLGQIDMAIVGGASDCKGQTLVLFSAARSLSANGSRPFDAEADGMICSEGYVTLVMKTLQRAIADGDPIHAVIRGIGISSDGKGKSLWAPRKEGQVKAMQRAYHAGLDMASVQYIEGHATATQVGDATELQTLSEMLAPHVPAGHKIPIGSVKANIGHTLESAGVASLIKTVLSMQKRMIPPAINIRQLNPKVDWDTAPFFVPLHATPWPAPAGGPCRAGVNAFGIGGLNVHVVLEEFQEAMRSQTPRPSSAAAAPAARSTLKPQGRPEGDDAIAVVGMGCLFPGALSVDKYWELLVSGRDPKQTPPPDRWRLEVVQSPVLDRPYRRESTLGGFITDFQYDWRRHKVPPKQVANADPLQFMLLEGTDQAMRDAGYDKRPFDRTRTGVVVGSEFGGDFAFQLQLGLRLPEMERILRELLGQRGVSGDRAQRINEQFASTLLKHWPALIDETGSFTASTLASRLAKTWNVMGGAVAVDSGATSAMSALWVAVNALRAGDCDMMICAAGQRRMGVLAYEMLARSGMLAVEDPPLSPLDARSSGVVPGEGVGVVVMKRLAQARADGDRIHAIIRGIAAAHSHDWGEAMQEAMQRAFQMADVNPSDVALLEFDGGGGPHLNNDELRATAVFYGRDVRREPLLLSSVTGQIGHSEGASGMASLIKANLQLHHGQIPATVGLGRAAPAIAEHPAMLRAVTDGETLRLTTDDGRRFAAVNSCSRGLAYYAVLERGEKVPVPPAPRRQTVTSTASSLAVSQPTAPSPISTPTAAPLWQLHRIGAATHGELLQKLDAAATNGQAIDRSPPAGFSAADRFRLVVVADSQSSYRQKLQTARQQINNPAAAPVLEQQGIYCRQLPECRPRIAFCFPGQGSQYAGMLQEIARHIPAANETLRQIDGVMSRLGFPTFAQLAWAEESGMGTDAWTTQVSVLLGDHIMHSVLTDCRVRPDLILGHSYGEYAALLASEAWDLETAVRITRARCDGIEQNHLAQGGMLATSATPEELDQLIRQVSGPVYVANHNAPDQTVVGGSSQALEELAHLLRARNRQTRLLPVPCPFHTPLMQQANGPLEQALRTADIRPPRVPTYSWVANRLARGPEEIRANLLAHFTAPVWYVDLIRRIADEADTVFLEVGPNQVLTRLHRRILDGSQIAITASDNPKRAGVEQLRNVQALLECVGALDQETPPTTVNDTSAAGVSPPSPQSSPETRTSKTEIIHFDATARRREKMRSAALADRDVRPAALDTQHQGSAPPVATASQHARQQQDDVAADTAVAAKPPAKPSVTELPPATGPQTAPADAAELESFLIGFVVEQTGYPPEVVELDADLEADLGIDSIKKAQLFGELAEYFDVTPSDDLTLDDFPTLRHVVEFLANVPTKKPLSEVPTSTAAAAEVTPPISTQATADPVTLQPPPAAETTDSVDLESFLIGFVVEQTGYPPEVVELDADLEADLGIDSIKKAQLFGELAEYFDVTPSDDLTLDDFPTLRHVLDFLVDVPIKKPLAEPASGAAPRDAFAPATQPQPLPPAQPQSSTAVDPLRSGQMEPAGPGTMEPPQPSAPQPSPVGEGHPALVPQPALTAEPAPTATTASVQAAPGSTAELEAFLINFVVEQTGYPPEVVELDADLEADLGIDSIKKAQLFGELAEYFDVTPTEGLTLDDFPTLRHVVNFLADAPRKPAAGLSASPASAEPQVAAKVQALSSADPPSGDGQTAAKADPLPSTSSGTRIIRLRGAPYEMGRQHGQQMKVEIRRALRRVADLNHQTLNQWLKPHARLEETAPHLTSDELNELQGIADGAEVALDNVVAYNLLLKSACRSASVPCPVPAPDNLPEGALDTAREALPKQLHECLLPVVQERQSDKAVERTLAFAGMSAGHLPGTETYDPPRDAPPATAQYDLDADHQIPAFSQRYVLRMLEVALPLDAPGAMQWNGTALIVGENETADALRNRLHADGVPVVQLPVDDDVDTALASFDRLWSAQPIHHLFLVTARDPDASRLKQDATWTKRYQRGVLSPYWICQRWMQRAGEAGLLDQCSAVSLVNLGGDFGFSGQVTAPEGGALTGLMKAIYLEKVVVGGHKGLRIKTIDAPSDEPLDSLADNVLRELAAATIDYEVAFVDGVRYLQNAHPADADVQSLADIRYGETWIATGGARGITAECALELGKRFGLKLHLIGTSPLPQIDPAWRDASDAQLAAIRSQTMLQARQAGRSPNEAWQPVAKAIEIDRSLRRFAEAGIQCTYHNCDVSDQAALEQVLQNIRQLDGPIDGILHGAGIDQSCRFEKKSREGVRATFDAKIAGAYNLMTGTWQDPIRHFIGFGSISGRLGSNGQTDYCAASEMLCKLASWYRTMRPECRAVGFHFHPWDDIGMAAKPEIKAMMKRSGGPEPMPKADGIRQFLRELYAGVPRTEVLITTPEYHQRFYGQGEIKDATAGAAAETAHLEATVAGPSAPATVTSPTAVTQRLVIRMMQSPLKRAEGTALPGGAAVILGENAASAALQAKLQQMGVAAHMLACSDDADSVLAQLDRCWDQQPVLHLFVMTPHDAAAVIGCAEDEFVARRNQGVVLPFLLCQRWLDHLANASLIDQATLVVCTSMGGDFGVSGNIRAVESGGLTGLIKSLHIEAPHLGWKGLKVKAVDFASDQTPQCIATAVCDELACEQPDLEVGYVGGRRHVVRVIPQPITNSSPREITDGGTWVVSGGARGVTAQVALALGRRYRLKLHLLGASPATQIDPAWRHLSEAGLQELKATISRQARAEGQSPLQAWSRIEKALEIDRNLQAFAQAGVQATYHPCDVSDRSQLAQILSRVRSTDGPIEGILHGAGVTIDAKFPRKKPENILRTLAAKVDGAAALMDLTVNDPVRYFVGFGSVSGRFGAKGQSDYATANDMLCKQIARFRRQRPDCVALGIHWHAWDDVGMAVKPEVRAMFEKMNYPLMPAQEGIEHLIDELLLGGDDAEVIFTDAQHYRDVYPLPIVAAQAEIDSQQVAPTASAALATASGGTDHLPVIERVVERQEGQQVVAESRYWPTEDPFLIDHTTGGKPLLPAVIALETLAEAASLLDGRRVVGFRNINIQAALPFHTDEPRIARSCVTVRGSEIECRLSSDYSDRKGRLVEADRSVVTALVELSDQPLELSIPHCGDPPIGWFPMEHPPDWAVQHGPRMRYLKNAFCQYDGGFGRIIAPPLEELAGARGSKGWLLAPAVLDACLVSCTTFSFVMFEKRGGLPTAFDQLWLARLPNAGEECVVRTYFLGKDENETRFDFVLFGEDKRVILSAKNYRIGVVRSRRRATQGR